MSVPPTGSAQTKFPDGSSFWTYTSREPEYGSVSVPEPGSKSTEPAKKPVERTLPALSKARPAPWVTVEPEPFVAFAQRNVPEAFNLATNASKLPPALSVVVPNVAAFWND